MSEYPGFRDNPEDRPAKAVRTMRFERKQKPTEKNPTPDAEAVSMQFEAVPDINGQPGIVGQAVVRGALYAIGFTLHDLQWGVEQAEREADRRRAEFARG